jgi:acyl carrier protein
VVASPAADILERLRSVAPRRRRALMLDHVLAETVKVLGIKRADAIEPKQGFFELGMDSLTSVELRNRLATSLRGTFPTTLAFDHPTPEALVEFLLCEVDLLTPGRPGAAPTRPALKAPPEQPQCADHDHLSLVELEDLIDQLAGPAP